VVAANIQRWMAASFSSTALGVNPGACSCKRPFSVASTVRQKGYQDVRLDAMLQLMVDRPNSQVALRL